MKHLLKHLNPALAIALVLSAAGAQAQAARPELGRWITQSGNLEIDIDSCGAAYCGTVVRVIAEGSMSGPAAPANAPAMASAAPSPLGKKILFDLQPAGSAGLQGRILNRGDNKTYNTQVVAAAPDQLRLVIYQDKPAEGQVQLWRRAGSASGLPSQP